MLINVLRNKPESIDLVRRLEGNYKLKTTAISTYELYHEAWKSRNPAKSLQAVETLLGRLEVYDFDSGASEEAGKILAGLEKKRQTS